MNLNATLIIQVISFLILVWFLARFAYKPFLDFLDKRSQKVKSMLDEARQNEEEAETKLKNSLVYLKKTKEEILKMRGQARKQIDEDRQKILADAQQEAKSILALSREDIERQIREVKESIKKEIADLSIDIAEKILDKEISKEDHQKIIKQSIKKLSKE